MVDLLCDGWCVCFLEDILIVVCVCCGVEDFGVACCFDAAYFAQALCLKGIKSVQVMLCECC